MVGGGGGTTMSGIRKVHSCLEFLYIWKDSHSNLTACVHAHYNPKLINLSGGPYTYKENM